VELILVRRSSTPWTAEDRVEGSTPLPPAPDGLEAIRKLAGEFDGYAPHGVYAWKKDPDHATGLALAEALDLPLWESEELRPLDMGSWTGLCWREVRHRFGRIYRRWHADPATFAPPTGETLAEATERLKPLLARLSRTDENAILVGSRELLLALCLICGEQEPAHPQAAGGEPWDIFDAQSRWRALELPAAE